jgi:hypothetical protein
MSERQTARGGDRTELQLERELEPWRGGRGGTQARPQLKDDLSICPCCGRDFVYPVDWAPVGERRWSVALRCPQCEWVGGGIYDQEVVDRFDDALDASIETILSDLELLTRSNMEEHVERFLEALEADLILPEDF